MLWAVECGLLGPLSSRVLKTCGGRLEKADLTVLWYLILESSLWKRQQQLWYSIIFLLVLDRLQTAPLFKVPASTASVKGMPRSNCSNLAKKGNKMAIVFPCLFFVFPFFCLYLRTVWSVRFPELWRMTLFFSSSKPEDHCVMSSLFSLALQISNGNENEFSATCTKVETASLKLKNAVWPNWSG